MRNWEDKLQAYALVLGCIALTAGVVVLVSLAARAVIAVWRGQL